MHYKIKNLLKKWYLPFVAGIMLIAIATLSVTTMIAGNIFSWTLFIMNLSVLLVGWQAIKYGIELKNQFRLELSYSFVNPKNNYPFYKGEITEVEYEIIND